MNKELPSGENSAEKRKESTIGLRGAIILALTALSAVSAVLILVFGKLIPAPLAEYTAFFYTYFKAGKPWLGGIFGTVLLAALGLCALSATRHFRSNLLFKFSAFALVFVDFAIHSYVFLASDGYVWNYLVSAALDIVMEVCILYIPRDKHDFKAGHVSGEEEK
jgi:hypothetical protein